MYLKILIILAVLSGFGNPQQVPESFELTPSGKFNQISEYDRTSGNGLYSCNFTISSAGDEYRELSDFLFYKNGELLYSLKQAPGSDLYISNSGITAFIDHTFHFRNRITINFYSPEGTRLSSLQFTGAYLFDFSEDGNIMGIGTPEKLTLFFIKENKTVDYPGCMQFAVNNSGSHLIMADQEEISVFEGMNRLYTLSLTSYARKIKVIDESSYCYITKNQFVIRSLKNNTGLYSNQLPNEFAYSDLLIKEGKIFTGINKREGSSLSGYISVFRDKQLSAPVRISQKNFNSNPVIQAKKDSLYDPIPWPFAPFDSARTAWNHYEQNMGGGSGDWSYLHQGLDLIVPINEPTYSVVQGFVKCVLTIGGDSYWRVAVSPVQEPGRSDGWLSAHIVESSIPVFPGDTVDIHEYLGNIIIWSNDWGHIHFVQINDSGAVWRYNDNEWGINFNPYLALEPLKDTIPPVIENSSTSSKFEFCQNETSNYLNADNLSGEIDIIVKVVDYIGDSEWQQPAFKSYYWIKRLGDDSIVVPRKPGHILNHSYPMYDAGQYEPYAKVLYKLDDAHPASHWMETNRDYWHIITNDNGDNQLDTLEKYSALDTRLFYDAEYRIYVEVYDPSGNSDIDSMDVTFNNGISGVSDGSIPLNNDLFQNYPNPFNPATTIGFQIIKGGRMTLKLYDILGMEIAVLLDVYKDPGYYRINFNFDELAIPSGVYFYKLNTGNFSSVKKLMLLK